MRSRITPARVTGAMALVVVLLLVSIPVFFAPVLPARAVEFLQVGHWVFNQATRTAFHVHGGSKEVDAKIALPAVGQGGAVVQGEAYGFVVDGRTVVGFGKSTLTVGGVIPTGLAEQPLGLEVPGGPYLIYRRAGSIVRLGLPAATIPGGGPISSAVATTDGTVWVRRADTGQICRLGAADAGVRCAVAVTGAPSGVLTVASGRPGLFDPAAGTLALIDGDALAAPVRVTNPLPPGAEVAANDAAGRLPVLAPGGRLLLVDTSWVAAPGRTAGGPVTVALGAGRYRSPVATDDAVAVLDLTRSRVLTFGRDGSRRRAAPVAAPADSARVVRGGDGKVYVDDATGAHTLVVDPDGAMTTVKLSGTDVPTTPPRRPEPPVTDRDRDRPRSADEPARAGTRGGGATTKGRRDTPAAVPGSPAPVLGRPGDAEVTVSWRKAAANGAAVLAYDVTWTAADGSPGGAVSVPGGNRTTLVPGLDNGTAYTFAVAARNSVGAGPAAVSAAVTPSSDVPSAPTGVTASAGTDGTLAVSWAEADGQGNTVTGYEVTAHGDDGSQAVVGAPTGTTVTLTAGAGITLGVTYTFTVTATNDKGLVSDPSEAGNAVAAYGPAAAPGDLRAEVANRAVTLTWAEPDLGGGALVGYLVDGDGVAPRTVTERSARFDELANGREHRFSVRAVTRSRADNGSATVEGAAASVTGTPGTAPAVDLVSVEATGDRAVTVRVVVDERDSGGVTCLVTLNGAERWRGGCAGTRDIRIDGLEYATVYNAQVHGSNAFGNAPGTQVMGARTNDPPRTVEVGRGGRVNRPDCNTAPCAWVTVAARNFAPDTSYSFVCRASTDPGGWYTFNARTDGNGSATINSGQCYFGFPGRDVWMTVGGVESNHYRW
jgi:hypothetical protein